MEGSTSTFDTTSATSEEKIKIAGTASSLFSDSIQSPFDAIFFTPINDSNPPPTTEFSQVDQPTLQIADISQISTELGVSKEPEEITGLTSKETGELDDLDDLVLGHTTSETSEVPVPSTIREATNDPALTYYYGSTEQNYYEYENWGTDDSIYQYQTYGTTQAAAGIEDVNNQHTQYPAVDSYTGTNELNNNYQEYVADTYTQYDNSVVGTNANNFNYSYTGYSGQPTVDTISATHQSSQQYPNYESNQSTVVNTPPPQSYSPFSPKVVQFVPCSYPQCTGENKQTAKFCSECGRAINESLSPVVDTPNIYQNAIGQQQYGTDSTNIMYGQQQYGTDSTNIMNDQQQYGTDSMNIVNDPLGRSKGYPIVAFGFGGRIFTMFPRMVQRFNSTNQNIPITKYAPGAFVIRTLKDIVPLPDIEDFPGPLLMDNNRGGIKAKRKNVVKYLNDQIKIAEDVLNSFVGEEVEKKKLEANTIIWHLFKIMFEHDGIIVGSPKVEEAVRCVLTPSTTKPENYESNFTVPAYSSFDSTQGLSELSTSSSLTYAISPKAIDTLQELLLKGDRVSAINHAINENLWAHALIIASCVNKDQWKEVVNGFIRHELGSQLGDASQSSGRESLRPANTTKFPPISPVTNISQLPPANVRYSPVSMNTLYPSSATCDIPIESLDKWRETLTMILANRTPGDNQAILALGDMLKEFGWIDAAHVCYILSPLSSIQSGIDDVNSRFTLVSKDYTYDQSIRFFCDWKALRLTEIYEFGLSLNNNDGLPFLQAYKLLYAWWLVDCVKVYTKGSPYFHGCFLQNLKDLTQRLLEHGGNSAGNNESSSWLFAKKMPKAALDSLWDSLEVKFNKFVAGDAVDENGQKPHSTISQEAVGPFSHFNAITQQTSNVPSRSVSAAEFRTTSDLNHDAQRSTTPNARLQKQINGNQRRSSTPGVGVQTAEYVNGGYNYNEFNTVSDGQISMSPVLENNSYNTSTIDDSIGHFGSFGAQGTGSQEQHKFTGYSPYNNSDNNMYQQSQPNDNGLQSENAYPYDSVPNGQQSTQGEYNYSSWSGNEANKQQQSTYPYYQQVGNSDTSYKNDSSWWNNPSPYTNYNDSQQDQIPVNNNGEGEFISPMDNTQSFMPMSASNNYVTNNAVTNNNSEWDNIEYDLGLGNNAFNSKKKDKQTDDNNYESTEDSTQESEQPKEDDKKEEKAGWFGRWFGKKEGGGKVANLGEESSFYFDPVQKRWVNKK
ncbi:3942_t:CDS:2, partial [Scutellospora calospora]